MDAFATYLGKKLKFDAHYFVRGGFWLSLSQLITILAGILTTSLFAKYLTESEYGTYRYLLTLVAIFSYFSLTGIGQSLLQAAAKGFNNFYKESFKTNLLYNSGVVISAFCGFIYYFLNENIVLSLGCLLIMLLQPVINLFQYTPTTLIGSKKFKESTLLQSLKTVFVTSTALASILVTQNVLILFSAYLVANALVNLISTWYFRQTTENNVTPLKQQNKLITYAKGTTVRHLILNLSGKLDIVILFTQVGAMEVAAYSIATLIPDQVRGFVKNMSQMLVPKYSQTENTAIILKSFPKRSLQIFILSAICTLVYIATSPIIYSLLFPKKLKFY